MNHAKEYARYVLRRLVEAGHESYFVGGCVRDTFLSLEPKDWDICTKARPHDIKAIFPNCEMVGAKFGVCLVKNLLWGVSCEVATWRKDGVYHDGRRPDDVTFADTYMDDLKRRDFTMNAMLMDLDGVIIDPFWGRDAIRAGLLQCVGSSADRMNEDYLRMLRAVRFAARYRLRLCKDIRKQIRLQGYLVPEYVAWERIRDEITKMLTQGRAADAFRVLSGTGLLFNIIPKMIALQGCKQPPRWHPEGDVWTHTILVLEQLSGPDPVLAWAALLHDIGKPTTQQIDPDEPERITFHGHQNESAILARDICGRFKMSNADTDAICWLVQHHMDLFQAEKMKRRRLEALIREPLFDRLLELHSMDIQAGSKRFGTYWHAFGAAESLGPHVQPQPPILQGRDLIALGMKPGPWMGQLLRKVQELYMDGVLFDKDHALNYVRGVLEREEVLSGLSLND